MYTFSIEKEHVTLLRVVVMNEIIEKDSYTKGLIEKCFERVFTMIREEKKEERDSSKEADLEDED